MGDLAKVRIGGKSHFADCEQRAKVCRCRFAAAKRAGQTEDPFNASNQASAALTLDVKSTQKMIVPSV